MNPVLSSLFCVHIERMGMKSGVHNKVVASTEVWPLGQVLRDLIIHVFGFSGGILAYLIMCIL